VDQQFIALTSYRHLDKTDDGKIRYTFGVPYTRFGTNYFPYSTLGENFITQRIPNMSKEGYWPLAPETVNQWKLFADDIRRDLRIVKAMGFQVSRLHHLELLWDKDPKSNKPYVDPAKRDEYLDFYFDELKHLGLKALLDIKLSPEEAAELVARYRPLVEGQHSDGESMQRHRAERVRGNQTDCLSAEALPDGGGVGDADREAGAAVLAVDIVQPDVANQARTIDDPRAGMGLHPRKPGLCALRGE